MGRLLTLCICWKLKTETDEGIRRVLLFSHAHSLSVLPSGPSLPLVHVSISTLHHLLGSSAPLRCWCPQPVPRWPLPSAERQHDSCRPGTEWMARWSLCHPSPNTLSFLLQEYRYGYGLVIKVTLNLFILLLSICITKVC